MRRGRVVATAVLGGVAVLALIGPRGLAPRLAAAGGGQADGAQAKTQTAQSPASASQPAQPATDPTTGRPIFRTGVNFVRVDAIVTDKNGRVVSDLNQSDFEVSEAGKPQVIETFKLVQLNGGQVRPGTDPPRAITNADQEEEEASRDDVRLFSVFLDDYHVTRTGAMQVRDQVIRFIQTQLGPSDMIGVMYPLESIEQVRMTRDHQSVIAAIQRFTGRKFEYTPMNQMEQQYAYYPTETVERIRNQVSLSAIKGLVTHMGSLKEGRKALILVSEGFSNYVPPQLRDGSAASPGYNPQRYNPQAGAGDPNEDRARNIAQWDMDADLREVYNTANRSNTAIYAIDPRGLTGSEFGIDQNIGPQMDRAYLNATMDTLRTLSYETDGRPIMGRNDLLAGLKQITADASAYYLLGYSSTVAPSDGKFHDIKVRVKRPGVQVRSRKGYWALTPEDVERATRAPAPEPAKPMAAALAALAAPPRARLIRSWIGTERGSNGKTKVTFVWEPEPGPSLGASKAVDRPVRVSVVVAGADGMPIFRAKVPDGDAARSGAGGATSAPGGAAVSASPAVVSFEVPPGKVQLRLAVEGASAEVLDSERREIDVPDLTAPRTLLGTPEVLRGRTARDMQQLRADPRQVPSPVREFSRMERLLVRMPVYAPGDSVPVVTCRVLNRAGTAISTLPASVAAGRAEIEVPLAGLPAGEYVIEVTANGPGGEAKELVGIRIAG
jgi:VWFA-related protein